MWHQGRYVWRPGFWAAVQPNWVWVPAHYVWAPRGYVFVDGYWDYSVGRRGVLFAPVYFDRGVYTRPGFSYSPTTVIDLGVFANHLFLRPRYQHYYFGDYYAANYQTAGFFPWFSFHSSRYGYDPIYAHQRWQNRQDPQWEQPCRGGLPEPPRSRGRPAAAHVGGPERSQHARSEATQRRGLVVAAPLDQLAKSKDSPLRFQPVDQEDDRSLSVRARGPETPRGAATSWKPKTAATSADKPPKEFVPAKVKLPRSPIVAKPVAELGKDHAPPKPTRPRSRIPRSRPSRERIEGQASR